ncbi:hypothetical protein Ancab_012091 [Ancistrocladus abbreviatus]
MLASDIIRQVNLHKNEKLASNCMGTTACLKINVQAPDLKKDMKFGEKAKELIEAEAKFLVGTYARNPVVLLHGHGCKLYDVEGK